MFADLVALFTFLFDQLHVPVDEESSDHHA